MGGGAVVQKERKEANRVVFNFVGSISKTVLFGTLSEEDATGFDCQNKISELQSEQFFVLRSRQRTDGNCAFLTAACQLYEVAANEMKLSGNLSTIQKQITENEKRQLRIFRKLLASVV